MQMKAGKKGNQTSWVQSFSYGFVNGKWTIYLFHLTEPEAFSLSFKVVKVYLM